MNGVSNITNSIRVATPLAFVLTLISCALVRPDWETNQGSILLSNQQTSISNTTVILVLVTFH